MIYLRNLLAEGELGIANFYMKRKAYIAAIGRAKYVIEHMPNTPQTPYALSLLVRAYKILGYGELAEENLKVLSLNYPDFLSEEKFLSENKSWLNKLSFGALGKKNVPAPNYKK